MTTESTSERSIFRGVVKGYRNLSRRFPPNSEWLLKRAELSKRAYWRESGWCNPIFADN